MSLSNTFKKLHIAFLDFDDIQNTILNGGQARATFEVAHRLVKLGHLVTIVCSRFPGSKDQTYEGIYYKHIGLGSRNVRINNIVWFFALPFAVIRLKADVIIEAFTAPISTAFAPMFTKIPVIGMPTMFEAPQFAKKYHLPFHWVEALGTKFYRYFLAYSPANKVKMESLNPRVFTRIIPNGVSEDMLTTPVTRGDYGFFIGRIDIVQKGLDILIQACLIAADKCPKLIIAGNGPVVEEAKLIKLIEDNKLSDRIKFVGRVDGGRKQELLAHAKFGLYPSRFEDFPLVPLELTGHEKPVVCFDIPGLRWVPHEVAIKPKAFDAKELAAALIRMNEDDEMRAKMITQCRPFAAKYGWNRIAEEYAEFCAEVVIMDQRRLNKKFSGKKVLVLGGAGFIGSILSYYLYERGDEVTIMDTLFYEKKPRIFFPLRFVKGDIRKRKDLEPEILRADVVVHLAALSNDPVSDLDPALTWEINHKANELIANLCSKYNKRIVFASSCSVYGFAETGVFNEESELNPVSLYAKTKVLSEKIYESKNIDVISLRFATAFGYTDKPRFDLVVNTMIGTAYFDKKIIVRGGEQWRPLVHVRDIAQAIYLAIHAKFPKYRVFNIGSNDQNYKITDLAKEIIKHFPAATVVEEKHSVDTRSYRVDFTRALELGFVAQYPVEFAVKEFLDAFRANKIESMNSEDYYRVTYLKNNFDLADLMLDLAVATKLTKEQA